MKLLIISPDKNDLTSFHRGFGVLGHLQKYVVPKLELVYPDEVSWATINLFDAVFLQRPFHNKHYNIASIAKQLGLPLWVDYDDNLFEVPTDNPTYNLYGDINTQNTIKEIVKLSDVVTVSTEPLLDVFNKLHSNVKLIPNSFNDKFCEKRKATNVQQKIVMWRGSNTHDRDLMEVSSGILELAKKHSDWLFVFWGHRPHWLFEPLPPFSEDKTKPSNLIFKGGVQPYTYYKELQRMCPAICIVPLEDSVFAKAKSCTASYQAFYAGGVPLVRNWKEWDIPGSIKYDTNEQFVEELDNMLSGKYDLHELNKTGWEWIKQNRLIGIVNQKRKQVIKELQRKIEGK